MHYYDEYLNYDEQYEKYCRQYEEESSSSHRCTYKNVDNFYNDNRPYSSRSRLVGTPINPKGPFGYLIAYHALNKDIQKHLSFQEYCTEEI